MSQQNVRDSARQAAASVPRRRNKPSVRWLGGFDDLPTALRDNNYIRRGYRLGYSSRDVLLSAFGWHNETGNIHTHLLGFMLFLVLTVVVALAVPAPFQYSSAALSRLEQQLAHLRSGGHSNATDYAVLKQLARLRAADWEGRLTHAVRYGRDSLADLPPRAHQVAAALLGVQWPASRWPLYVFLAGAMACLLTSATCHLLSCCSQQVNQLIWRFDYVGIAVLTVASFYPPCYYGFMCRPTAQLFYLLSTTLLGLAVSVVTLMPFFQVARCWHGMTSPSHRSRTFRAAMFAALGLWGVAPYAHAWHLNAGNPHAQKVLHLDAWMGAVYLGGAAVYALRIPERFKPGHFDYLFNSHQLFHLAVVAAAFIHYHACLTLLQWRDESAGCPPEGLLDVDTPV